MGPSLSTFFILIPIWNESRLFICSRISLKHLYLFQISIVIGIREYSIIIINEYNSLNSSNCAFLFFNRKLLLIFCVSPYHIKFKFGFCHFWWYFTLILIWICGKNYIKNNTVAVFLLYFSESIYIKRLKIC